MNKKEKGKRPFWKKRFGLIGSLQLSFVISFGLIWGLMFWRKQYVQDTYLLIMWAFEVIVIAAIIIWEQRHTK